ncbi:MAG: sulfite exporter TauE/SafE family protein [Candidatus Binatia bacterium]
MPLDPTTIAVGAALLLAAFVKGTTGFGFPLIATPMVALLLDIRTAITILIIPNILMDVAQIFRGSFPAAIIKRFGWLLFLTVFGVFLGTKVLVMLPIWALNLSLGAMVLAFVVSNFFRFEPAIPPRLERLYSPVIGLAVGFLNGMTNAAGPVLASYLYSLKLPKTEFVRSISTIFMITKLSQLVAVSTWNLFTFETLRLSGGVTVFVLLGFYFGLKTQERVNQKTFNRGLLIILFAIGVMLVVRGLR